ncbi:hypothetical protein I305_00208 [Cryptococcus gattii E566]|uniref:Uncharacterized protein n=2 Tax=Cryptococcus gattii TaxID=37769 RepID=E6QXZ4_CRYGW|nr:Hypothetical Protein CGB_A5500C [Cryptococcus gattii WM276]ADV19733.1 Hypothetical Protein CGB_A5500C [Cryptococcus gattii WM276]KIR79658.1 hypothetical protein I306_03284 [Cryptococcus gattii EJB2]KIY37114.1 hypothetical protein I305_00208 [Cryptococcus gattii E566]KJE00823.1 hypothetical protein I311_05539 [Cryptococcus gattii NT-10]
MVPELQQAVYMKSNVWWSFIFKTCLVSLLYAAWLQSLQEVIHNLTVSEGSSSTYHPQQIHRVPRPK